MSDQQDLPPVEEMEAEPNPYARRKRRWHWLFAFAVLAGGMYYIVHQPAETAVAEVPPEMQVTPPSDAATPAPTDPGAQPAPASVTSDDPLAPIESSDLNQPVPPPVTSAEEDPVPPAPMPAEAEVEPAAPAPPPPPEEPAPKRKAEKKADKGKKKTYTLAFNKSGTKVPTGLKKDKVIKYLAKKLDGDKTCLPKTLTKKDAKAFTALVNVSKTGAVTAVTTQPKIAESKKIAACIKKKLSGSPAVFKGKGKSSARITIALKMK